MKYRFTSNSKHSTTETWLYMYGCSNIATVYLSILTLTFCDFFIRCKMFYAVEEILNTWWKSNTYWFMKKRFLYGVFDMQTRITN